MIKPSINRSQWIVLAGMVVVSLSLRPAVASVSPLLESIRSTLGLSYTAVSLLTTIPTLCMGVFALSVPKITDAVGRERGVFWGIILITVATAARVWSENMLILFSTTILVGVGIAVTQALLPPLVTEYFPDRVSFATGLYTTSLTIGAALASGITAPVADTLSSWSGALAIWAIPAALAVPLWLLCWKQVSRQQDEEPSQSERPALPWRSNWARVLMVFFGGSSTVFFFVLTWLAPRYVALGWTESSAGALLSVFVLTQLGGNLLVSAIGDQLSDHRILFEGMLLLVVIGAAGVAIVPRLIPYGWSVLLGIGAGGIFTLGLTLPSTYTTNPTATDGLSSMILGGGYLIASVGPSVAGGIRDLTGSYSMVFGGLIILAVVLMYIAITFTEEKTIDSGSRIGYSQSTEN